MFTTFKIWILVHLKEMVFLGHFFKNKICEFVILEDDQVSDKFFFGVSVYLIVRQNVFCLFSGMLRKGLW